MVRLKHFAGMFWNRDFLAKHDSHIPEANTTLPRIGWAWKQRRLTFRVWLWSIRALSLGMSTNWEPTMLPHFAVDFSTHFASRRNYSELFPQARSGEEFLRVWPRPSNSIFSSPPIRPSKSAVHCTRYVPACHGCCSFPFQACRITSLRIQNPRKSGSYTRFAFSTSSSHFNFFNQEILHTLMQFLQSIMKP